MNYIEKLKQFNSTDKYKGEMYFLKNMIQPIKSDNILDYGCGIGTMVTHLLANSEAEVFGYDIHDFTDGNNPFRFRKEYHIKFNKVYFMHSIAHIDEVIIRLDNLKEILVPDANVYVLTPNYAWILLNQKEDYVPDPTLVKHFYQYQLAELFINSGYNIINQGQFGKEVNGQNERLFLTAQWKI